MKITETSPLHGTSKAKKKSKSDGGAFDGMLSGAEEAEASGASGQATATANIGNIDALLSLQEVSGDDANRQQLIKDGNASLDVLDDLRRDMLIGQSDGDTVGKMQRQLNALKSTGTEDPHLKGIIQDIELRLAVEIAKFEMN